MADAKISALTTAGALDGTEYLALVQSSASKKVLASVLKTFFDQGNATSYVKINDYLMMGAGGTASTFCPGGEWRGGPTVLPPGCTWDRVRSNIDVAGTAGCTSRLVIFDDNGSGRPGNVLVDSSNFASDSAVAVTTTVSITPAYRIIWPGIVTNGSPATAPKWAWRTTHVDDYVWPSEDSSGPVAYYSGSGFTWGITMSGAAGNNPTMMPQSINGQPRFAFRRSA